MRKINRLNEELARWAFEIIFKTNTAWKIAFTNPTAGPWKTIKATSMTTGAEGEVYRFILEEDRPDIIMYNDELKIIIIFEAKDSLEKLIDKEQAKKSAAVVVKLAHILRSKGSNEFWKGREKYPVVLGLLWGSTDSPKSTTDKKKLYDCYHNLIKNEELVLSDLIVGVETLYRVDNLSCTPFFVDYSGRNSNLGNAIINSLKK